jgi:CyaY protein
LSSLSEEEYDALAFPELGALIRALDALEHPDVEAELASDILTIEFADGTRYVVNSHRAARQIWMAAERSAWHFDWVPAKRRWIAEKTGDELWSTVSRAIEKRLGSPVSLVREEKP